MSQAEAVVSGVEAMPVANVEWVPRETLNANGWNPNKVFPPELRLLKLSILEDGWTQPIVARDDGTIIDGYHRWLCSEDKKVAALTGGLVPVVRVRGFDDAHQRMSTIRHNRARGSHHVVKIADIVTELVEQGLEPEEIQKRLGMEREEVTRMIERGKMTKRAAGEEFKKGWAPQ